MDPKNKETLRRAGSIPIFWDIWKTSPSKEILQLIVAVCKSSKEYWYETHLVDTQNQKLFEQLGLFESLIPFITPEIVQSESALVADVLCTFKNFNSIPFLHSSLISIRY
jgi:hypothetical protein